MMKDRSPRPWRVTLLIVLVLSLAVFHALGVWEVARTWDFLHTLPLTVPPEYLLGRNLFWALLGVILTFGLWRGAPWVWGDMQIAACAYAAWYWLDRIFLAPAARLSLRWPALVMFTLLGLAFVFWAVRSPAGKWYFDLS